MTNCFFTMNGLDPANLGFGGYEILGDGGVIFSHVAIDMSDSTAEYTVNIRSAIPLLRGDELERDKGREGGGEGEKGD